ncbi:hypothetical protein [Methylocystis parvus]|uniref:hypothetical protein n=1 Tax=Methylocystis parvus TaxID=134 RepID=UPI003C748299
MWPAISAAVGFIRGNLPALLLAGALALAWGAGHHQAATACAAREAAARSAAEAAAAKELARQEAATRELAAEATDRLAQSQAAARRQQTIIDDLKREDPARHVAPAAAVALPPLSVPACPGRIDDAFARRVRALDAAGMPRGASRRP